MSHLRSPSDVGEAANVYVRCMLAVARKGQKVYYRALAAFGVLARRCLGPKACGFTGFACPGMMSYCILEMEELLFISKQIAERRSCVQPLYSNHHFVLSVKMSGAGNVMVYNRSSSGLSTYFQLPVPDLQYGQQSSAFDSSHCTATISWK